MTIKRYGTAISALLGALAAFALTAPVTARPVEPPPLDAYGELPELEDLALSPSGNRLAALMTFKGSRMLVVLDGDHNPVRSFNAEDLKIRDFRFIDDASLLLQRSSTQDLPFGFVQSQFEFYQSMIVPLDETAKLELVFGNRPNLMNATFGNHGIRWIDGRPVGFFEGVELRRQLNPIGYVFDHGRPGLYSVDLIDNSPRRVEDPPSEGKWRDWLVGEDGRPVARLDVDRNTGEWTIRNGDGKRMAEGRNGSGEISLRMIGKDGKTIIYEATDAGGDWSYYEVPIDGSGSPEPAFDDIGIERFYTDGRTGRLIGYLPDGEGAPVYYDENIQESARRVRRAFEGKQAQLYNWTDDFQHLLVHTSGNKDSGSYYLVDLAGRRADLVGIDRPRIDPAQVGPISRFEYEAADGLELDGILTLPPGLRAEGLPLVVLPHGGPHAADTEEFDWFAQAFASRGYAVFQPNFRGSTNRDDAFMRAGYGEWGRKMQTDISDGVAALAAKGIVDPARACIVGASYGGYAALAGVTLQQGIYRCAVAVAPVSDLNLHFTVNYRDSGRSRMLRRSLEEELGPRRGFDDISPSKNADRANAPILLIHGRDDTVVEFRQSDRMADALKRAGKQYRLVELDGEDHWLSRSETRKLMLEEAVGFVQQHNPAD